MTSEDDIVDIFSADGPLSGVLEGYAPRTAQQRMAEAVAVAIDRMDTLVVEAGTGVGKTLAYLVPALLSDRRVVISTGTRNLQDQLFHRDLPAVTAALGQPVSVALLKGRANYLCRYRMQRNAGVGGRLQSAMRTVLDWAHTTSAGDIAEVSTLGEGHPVWPLVTSNNENCLGQECPEFSRCHVVKARRAAQSAQVVIVNHHLLLADFSLKEEGFGELLPGADACIVDEAHQLPETAARFFGTALGARQVQGLITDIERESFEADCDGEALRAELVPVRDALAALRESLGAPERRVHYSELGENVADALGELGESLAGLSHALDIVAGASTGLDAAARRIESLQATIGLLRAEDEEAIRWAEITRRGFSLHSTPLDVAEPLQSAMYRADCAWVFTSATLAVGERFDHFATRMGLEAPTTLALGSPFDFEQNALLCLPQSLPEARDPEHTARLLEATRPLLEAAGGGVFYLFTSHRALRAAARELDGTLANPLLVQGDAPRDELLRRFRAAGNAVLLGAASFWEGVDVRGDALRLVVIDKLPFASPGDPVMQARLDALRRRGLNPFMHYQLPQAVLSLKQGAGRLIRDPQDTGVCVIGDARITGKHYGRVFLASLPPMRVTRSLEEAAAFLRERRGA